MSITLQQIEALAPDQASLNAAQKLRKPAKWPLLALSAERDLLWGECQGSGSTPYRLSIDRSDLSYRCSCPSRKFPCKHVLALLWMLVESPSAFSEQVPAQWVEEWLSGRRKRAGAAAQPGGGGGGSITAAKLEASKEEPESAEKVAQRAARAEAQRELRERQIAQGLDELDRWLADQLQRGIADLIPDLPTQARLVASRLVDAKAGGLAARIDQLAADTFARPEAERLDFLFTELGALHLLSQAYRHQQQLPSALRADVRRMIGWDLKRDALLEEASAPRVKGHWVVAGRRNEIQVDNLRRIETWLLREEGSPPTELESAPTQPRFALLLDYHPLSAGHIISPFNVGDRLAGELIFYPSALPLRAQIVEHQAVATAPQWPPAEIGVAGLLAAYRQALVRHPWAALRPFLFRAGALAQDREGQLHLTDSEEGQIALPLARSQQQPLRALAGLALEEAIGLWDGWSLTLLTVSTEIGRWVSDG